MDVFVIEQTCLHDGEKGQINTMISMLMHTLPVLAQSLMKRILDVVLLEFCQHLPDFRNMRT